MLKLVSAAAAVAMLVAGGLTSPASAASPSAKGVETTTQDLSSAHVRRHRVYPRHIYHRRVIRPYYATPYYGAYYGYRPYHRPYGVYRPYYYRPYYYRPYYGPGPFWPFFGLGFGW